MALTSSSIPNLIQGVSQQPDSLRSVSQLEAQENCFSSTVEGLSRRPPTEHIQKISSVPFDTAFIHTINRDVTQRYKMVLSNGGIQVFGLDGVQKTIAYTDENLEILPATASMVTGATFQIAAAPGETLIDFTVTGITTATVIFEASPNADMSGAVPLATVSTNGTTVGLAIGANLYMRARISAWTSGSVEASVTYKNVRYLLTTDAKSKMRALTVADYTFVLNTEVIPGMDTVLSPSRTKEALVFVNQGQLGSVYNTYIDGFKESTFTTSATDNTTDTTANIATNILNDLNTARTTCLLLPGTSSVKTGVTRKISPDVGVTSVDYMYGGTSPVGTTQMQMSVDGVAWDVVAQRSVAGTTFGIPIGSYIYVRIVCTVYTSGVINGNANYNWGYGFQLSGSTVWVQNLLNNDFAIKVDDPQGQSGIMAFKDTTLKFSSLPAIAPNGFVIAIDPDPSNDKGKYFVQAVSRQATDTFGQVNWTESIKQGIPYSVNQLSMPYALIHNPDDTFNFKVQPWVDRLVGETTLLSNPDPSFIGTPINEIMFYKNRLGFLSDENFVFSEIGQYFNFWRTSIAVIKDSDPVDSRASNITVSILKRAVIHNKNLMLFSDQTQFLIPNDVALTSKTVRCDAVSNYTSLLDVAPVNAGAGIYFMFNRESYAGMCELTVSQTDSSVYESDEVSAHVPAYIPAGVFRLANSTLADCSVVLTTGDPSAAYVYKTKSQKTNKVQSAWFRWNFADNTASVTKVLNADWIDSTLYLMIQRNGEVFLEKIRLLPNFVDANSTYVTCLDRRLTEAQITGLSYNAFLNQTTFTLPYAITSSKMVVATRGIADNTGKDVVGRILQIVSATIGGTTMIVTGNYTNNPLWIGQRFFSNAQLSTLYVRKPSPGGTGLIVDSSGILQLLKGTVVYSKSGPFVVSVTPVARPTSDYIFSGLIVGDSLNIVGATNLRSGQFKFSILTNNETVKITLHSDSTLPFHFTSLDWEGNFTKRSQGR